VNKRERENIWITQENELPLTELPNHVRPYRKLVTIYSELHGLQCKFRQKFSLQCWELSEEKEPNMVYI